MVVTKQEEATYAVRGKYDKVGVVFGNGLSCGNRGLSQRSAGLGVWRELGEACEVVGDKGLVVHRRHRVADEAGDHCGWGVEVSTGLSTGGTQGDGAHRGIRWRVARTS